MDTVHCSRRETPCADEHAHESSSSASPLARAAAWYARRGWPVVPLHWVDDAGRCSCGDPACRSAGKHPLLTDWPRRATTDPATIAAWWRKWPRANIGVALRGGHVVLDVDPRNGGDDELADLEHQYGPLPPTPIALTGSGGVHYHFTAPPDTPTVTLAPGLELKATGAQVVLPPSRSAAGWYRWDAAAHVADLPLAPLPDWLLALARPGQRRPGQSRELPPTIAEGSRNLWLTSLAGSLRRRGCTEEEIFACLRVLNASRCQPPLDERELAAIARSVARYAPACSSESPAPARRRRVIRLEVRDAQ